MQLLWWQTDTPNFHLAFLQFAEGLKMREFKIECPCPDECPKCDAKIHTSQRFCWQCGYQFSILYLFYWAIIEERLQEELEKLGEEYIAPLEAPLCESRHGLYVIKKFRFCPFCGIQLV